MAEIQTLARPYADAVFDLARERDALGSWSNALAVISAIVSNEDTATLLGNPEIDDERLARAIIDVGGDELPTEAANLVRLLAENGRLALAPAIAAQFEIQRAEAEDRIDVRVVSAVDLSDTQAQALSQALEKRLARTVRLTFERDENIIGGAIIRAGDLVIDGSLRAQLERMRHSLSH